MQNLKIKDVVAAQSCAAGKQPVGMLSMTQKQFC